MSESTHEKASWHDTTKPLLDAMYLEFKELSKKNPSAALSKQKIRIVNRLLTRILQILDEEESRAFLDLLDEDDIPQVSDVALILSQYVAAMNSFKSAYFRWDGHDHVWFTSG